jgi:hypothetical protein
MRGKRPHDFSGRRQSRSAIPKERLTEIEPDAILSDPGRREACLAPGLNRSIRDDLKPGPDFKKAKLEIELDAILSDPGRGEACLAPG